MRLSGRPTIMEWGNMTPLPALENEDLDPRGHGVKSRRPIHPPADGD